MVCFHCPDSQTDTYNDTYSDEMYKCSTGTYSNDDTDAKLQWKSVKHHIISTDIGAK